MSVLGAEQQEQFETDGYLVASGLIPDDVSSRAEAFMWELMGMDRTHPDSWTNLPKDVIHLEQRNLVEQFAVKDKALLACCTPEFMAATAQLIHEPQESLHIPGSVQTQNVFPVAGPWKPPGYHVDGIPKENMHRTFPGPFRIAKHFYKDLGQT